ncbi:MAG TPA: bifunctional diguanylate cyclase/phosphodiesterase [Candidatus Binatia bacterium]|nr:bifunctional diguanylate cyclase/phosphodiesterase [Candidatus Binatia bacterium]
MRQFSSSIRLRLLAGFGAIALLMAGGALYFGQFVQQQREGLETLRNEQESFQTLNRMATGFTGYQAAVLNRETTPAQIQSAWDAFRQRLDRYALLAPEPAARLDRLSDEYRQRAEALRALQGGRDAAAIQAAIVATRDTVIRIGAVLRESFDSVDARYKALLAGQLEAQRLWDRRLRWLTLAAVGLLLLYAAFLLRAIVGPMTAAVRGIKAVRAGAMPDRLPRGGEFSEIGSAIDELGAATRAVHRLAYTDALTGLGSQAGFAQALAAGLADEQGAPRPLTVVLVEVTQLSMISSAHGPAVADRCLEALSQKLGGLLGEGRALSRVGDTRFAFYVPGVPDRDTEMWAENLMSSLAEPIGVESLRLRVSPCAGLARCPGDGADAAALLASAETALASARTRKDGRAAWFDRALADSFRADLLLAHELERALAHDEFVPYYEPVINLARGEVISCEALVRWRHPERGLLPPKDFVPLAERTGQIALVDDRMFELAAQQLGAWRDAGHNFSLSFNISPHTLMPVTVDRIRRRLTMARVPAHRLIAELTETAIIQHEQDTHQVIRDLHALGTTICLDDFGIGYSSLSYLMALPITRLKVDRSFVAEIGRSATAERIIEATLLLAQQLGITVVAEGVETVEQMKWLLERRCIRQQGWLFARAQPAAEFEAWLRQVPEQLAALHDQLDAAAA